MSWLKIYHHPEVDGMFPILFALLNLESFGSHLDHVTIGNGTQYNDTGGMPFFTNAKAEKYHQFHDDMLDQYGDAYHALRQFADKTQCPGDQSWPFFISWMHWWMAFLVLQALTKNCGSEHGPTKTNWLPVKLAILGVQTVFGHAWWYNSKYQS